MGGTESEIKVVDAHLLDPQRPWNKTSARSLCPEGGLGAVLLLRPFFPTRVAVNILAIYSVGQTPWKGKGNTKSLNLTLT